MPITKEILAYRFEELSDRAKHNAMYAYPSDFSIRDYDPENWIDMETSGIKNYKLASWDTNPIEATFSRISLDFDRLIAKHSESLRDQRNLYRIVKRFLDSDSMTDMFCCIQNLNYRDPIIEIEPDYVGHDRPCKRTDRLLNKYAEKLTEHVRDCEREVARSIAREYEYTCSEEYFQDIADANDYLFDENGNLI
jgi:hypothetical protein